MWSLGATLFHVLSGRPPYDIGDNVLGGLYRIVNEEPPRLADAGWMAPLLEATMVKDPARRWSMAQVRDFLAAPRTDRVGRPAAAAARRTPDRAAEPRPRVVAAVAPLGDPPPASSRGCRGAAPARSAVALVLVVVLFAACLRGAVRGRRPRRCPHRRDQPVRATSTGSPQPPAAPSQTAAASRPPRAWSRSSATTSPPSRPNPDTAWPMLTPKFQRESGGLDTYRKFWGGVGTGRILDISADPRTLVVSYRVRFDNFGTGRARRCSTWCSQRPLPHRRRGHAGLRHLAVGAPS